MFADLLGERKALRVEGPTMARKNTNGPTPPGDPEPAYFLSLEVGGVRCFKEKQTLSLSDDKGRPVQWTIILGNNGSGKTTLLQCLAGFEMLTVPLRGVKAGSFFVPSPAATTAAGSVNEPSHAPSMPAFASSGDFRADAASARAETSRRSRAETGRARRSKNSARIAILDLKNPFPQTDFGPSQESIKDLQCPRAEVRARQ